MSDPTTDIVDLPPTPPAERSPHAWSPERLTPREPPGQTSPAPQVQPPKPDPIAPLRRPHFRLVWTAAAVSSVGTWMETFGMTWAMTYIAQDPSWAAAGRPSAATMLAFIAAAQLLPMFFLGMAGGIVADRVDRRRMLIVTQTVLMLTAAALAVASAMGRASATVLILVSIVQGTTMAFNVPAWQVMTPRLVPRDELARAIALQSLQFNMARVIGPLLAGLLMFDKDATVLFALNTLSFLGVIFAVAKTPPPPAMPEDRRRGGLLAGALRDTREATSFVFHNRGPRAVFIGVVLFSVLAGPLLREMPAFVTQVYQEQEKLGSALLAIMGLGAVLGAFLLPRLPSWYPRHHFIPLAMAGGGLSISLFCAVPDPLFGGAIMFAIGLFWIWSFSSSIAAMQLLVSDSMRGRVMAVTNTAVFGASPLGALMTAGIEWIVTRTGWANAEALGVQIGLGALSGALLIAAVVMLTWRTPEVDGLKPGDDGYDRKPGLIRGILASGHRPRPAEVEATVDATGRSGPM